MIEIPDPLAKAFRIQQRGCVLFGSPFYGEMIERLIGSLAGEVAPLLDPWRDADLGRLIDEVVPLRLLGGLHHLVLTGAEPGLAAHYPAPGRAIDWARLEPALRATLVRRREPLAAFMSSPPQTNEVRRALCLLGGFLTVAGETGLPLRYFEIGASAGLLQNWDSFFYDLGEGMTWGDPASPVRIDGDWSGQPPPLDAAVRVIERSACDVGPIPLDEEHALRLQAYVWPDQFDRLDRLRAAIGLARDRGVRVERADAGVWVARTVRPEAGVATVLYHSVMWQYMPAVTRNAVRDALEAAGDAATPRAPLAWLRMEPPSGALSPTMEIRLTTWPGGEERLLARVHPHGAAVEWLGAQTGA